MIWLAGSKSEELVSVGDVAMIKRKAIKLNGTSMAGKAMDDKGSGGDACLFTGIQRLHHLADVVRGYCARKVGCVEPPQSHG